MLNQIILFIITVYQKIISPRKGFACAHRVYLNDSLGCSGYGKKVFKRFPFFIAYALLRRRLMDCRFAMEQLQNERMGSYRRLKAKPFASQRGECDCSGCDAPDCSCDSLMPDCSCDFFASNDSDKPSGSNCLANFLNSFTHSNHSNSMSYQERRISKLALKKNKINKVDKVKQNTTAASEQQAISEPDGQTNESVDSYDKVYQQLNDKKPNDENNK